MASSSTRDESGKSTQSDLRVSWPRDLGSWWKSDCRRDNRLASGGLLHNSNRSFLELLGTPTGASWGSNRSTFYRKSEGSRAFAAGTLPELRPQRRAAVRPGRSPHTAPREGNRPEIPAAAGWGSTCGSKPNEKRPLLGWVGGWLAFPSNSSPPRSFGEKNHSRTGETEAEPLLPARVSGRQLSPKEILEEGPRLWVAEGFQAGSQLRTGLRAGPLRQGRQGRPRTTSENSCACGPVPLITKNGGSNQAEEGSPFCL